MKIGVFGRGRLGTVVAAAAGADLAWHVGRDEPPGAADVAVDASVGPAVAGHVAWALDSRSNLVIGATGWDMPDLAARVGTRIGVVVAPNFSLTVALLARLTRIIARYAASDARFDPYLVEHHYAKKADAPSGTARMLAKIVLEACPRKTAMATPHDGAIRPTDFCVASVRAGSSASNSHTVTIEAPEESLSVRHEGKGSAAYGPGAIAACRWVLSRRGVFTMNDVAKDVLNPLFEETP